MYSEEHHELFTERSAAFREGGQINSDREGLGFAAHTEMQSQWVQPCEGQRCSVRSADATLPEIIRILLVKTVTVKTY